MPPTKKFYYVILFLTKPYWKNEKRTAVPSTWVLYCENQAMVAFPMLSRKELKSYIKNRQPPVQTWPTFPVTIEYKSDVYKDAILYIKFRQQLSSSDKASSAVKQASDGTQALGEMSTELSGTNVWSHINSNLTDTDSENETFETPDSCEQGASATTQQILRKATEHDLLEKILDKFTELNGLLQDYIQMKYQYYE